MPKAFKLGSAAAAAVVVLLATACGSGVSAPAANGGVQLTLEGPGEPQTDNFNPFLPTSSMTNYGITTFIYEPLLQFDLLKPGTVYSWLATSYRWSNGDRILTFSLRHGVTWSDGKPFTSADVVWTFEMLKRYPALNTNGVTFTSVAAQGPYTVVMTFAQPAYPQFYNVAGETYIVPMHIWDRIANPVDALNTHPVGTGPMLFQSFSPENLILVKNPHYWQAGKVKVTEMQFPTASVDTDVSLLSEGKMDWASGAFAHIQQVFVDKSPDNHYWFPPEGVVALVPNMTVYPLASAAVRKAISLAMDRTAISAEGESGYEAPATSPTGLVLPNDQSYLAPQYAGLSNQVNLAQARELLASAGLVKGPGGYLAGKNGKPITLTIVDPTDFPDYMTDAQIIAADLKAIGLDATVSGVSVPGWTSDLDSGNFQLTIDYSNVGPSPYYWYDGWLDDTLTAPVGKTASADVGRWQDPATQALLSEYQTATTDSARLKAVQGLEGIMVRDVPVIPLVYSAVWGEYSDTTVVGWPSPSDPYESASSYPPGNEVVLTRLQPRG
jgi:peptide/nickel transport system substrate-binding protein